VPQIPGLKANQNDDWMFDHHLTYVLLLKILKRRENGTNTRAYVALLGFVVGGPRFEHVVEQHREASPAHGLLIEVAFRHSKGACVDISEKYLIFIKKQKQKQQNKE
jgi:hypothetical protein